MLLLEGSPLFSLNLSLNPSHNHPDNINNLHFIHHPTLLNAMPLLDTSSATGGGCMLGNEYRMPSHPCLFAVILGKIRRNSGIYELICVLYDGFKTFGGYLIPVFL